MNNTTTIAFKMPEKPVRTSAKAIILKDDKVLLTKNFDFYGDFYLLPGGGQRHKETLVDTLKRECFEETGANIEVGDLLFVREYISENHEFAKFGKEIHQVEFIFKCNLLSGPNFNLNCNKEPDASQIGIEWVSINDLESIRIYPKILSKLINKIKFNKALKVYLGDVL